jgi:hypothetical protein
MILPPADFVAMFFQVLAMFFASTIFPIAAIFGVGLAFVMVGWVMTPFGSLVDSFKRMGERF